MLIPTLFRSYLNRKAVYSPRAFFPHAVSLRQAFAHCGIFLTAATRRCMDRVSVPFWLVVLSDQLPVIALVSRYLTNELIGRRPLPNRKIFPCTRACARCRGIRYYSSFRRDIPEFGAGTNVLRSRLPWV